MIQRYRIGFIFVVLALVTGFSCNSQKNEEEQRMEPFEKDQAAVKLFLCGDVMTGRAIDQALPFSVDPLLYEPYVKDARIYLQLAEEENGDIEVPVSYEYIWGDALEVWDRISPDLKLINLETSITAFDKPWPNKGIHYRMHPENVELFKVAGIDHVSLANNHILDWHRLGMEETMEALNAANIKFSGVGKNENLASEPSILATEEGRVFVYSYGAPDSGIPSLWAATKELSGLNFLPDFSEKAIENIEERVKAIKEDGDIVVFSIHWGGNWGYEIPGRHRNFAHQLIDEAGVDVIYGHSSHHPMGIEVYKEKLIIYGAGDFINDYEGIGGHEQYRGELSLMYFPGINKDGTLQSLKLVPMEIKNLQLNHAVPQDAEWLQQTLNREGEELGTRVRIDDDHSLLLEWE